jgi:hypothetical protein
MKKPRHTSPRERVRRHMKVLLATGTAVAISACEAGQIVCDPLPPPLQCSSDPATSYYLTHLRLRAVWRAAGTDFVIDVTASPESSSTNDVLAFPYDPIAMGGVVRNVQRAGDELNFVLVPGRNAPQIDLTLPLDCSGTKDALYLRLDLRQAPPADGGSIPIESIDSQDP